MSVQYSGDKITFADGSIVASGWSGFKNRIINGAMMIDQRNAGASVTSNASGVFSVDRWNTWEDSDGTATVQQSTTAPAGFVNSLLWTTGTADASLGATQYCMLQHRIEGTNIADLAWGTANAATVTLSFWVRSSLTGTFGGALRNSAGNRSYPFSYTISAANTFEYKTITIAGDTTGTWLTNNNAGINVEFGLGVGSTYSGTAGAWAGALYLSATGATSVIGTAGATFYITGVQLEKGSTATSFDYHPYGTELALCQRYYEQFTTRTGGETLWTAQIYVPYKVSMRSSPTVSAPPVRNGSSGSTGTGAVGNVDTEGANITSGGLSGSSGNTWHINGAFTISAEL